MDLMTMRARPNAADLEEEAFSKLKKEGGHAFVTLRGKYIELTLNYQHLPNT